ncbi:MAG: MotA/TolQ/ExbB proton channel family protein [Granulosicoccus sp.]
MNRAQGAVRPRATPPHSEKRIYTRPIAETGHYYPQAWLLMISVMIFGAYVAWDLGVFGVIAALDQSYMASLIIALVILASIHCGWHIIHNSQRIKHSLDWLNSRDSERKASAEYTQTFLQELVSSAGSDTDPSDDAIVEIYADRLRAPAELGWFFVDLAVRLGLLGTIIGFILIFASLTNIKIDGGDDLKNLLIAMSGGMGTALLTTLTGLIGASLLSVQYLLLGREAEHQVGLLLRMKIRNKQKAAGLN